MTVWPEERLRAELERTGGPLEVPTERLLETFGVRRPTELARRNIEDTLSLAGMRVEPSLAAADGRVKVSLRDRSAPPTAEPSAVESPAPATREPPPPPRTAPPRPPRPIARRPLPRRRPRRANDVRGAAVEIVSSRPGISQRDLVERLFLELRVARTRVLAAVRELERDGTLVSRRVERRKAYFLAEPRAILHATVPIPRWRAPRIRARGGRGYLR